MKYQNIYLPIRLLKSAETFNVFHNADDSDISLLEVISLIE